MLTPPLTYAKIVPMTVSLAIAAIIVSPVIQRLITVNLMIKLEDAILSKDILRAIWNLFVFNVPQAAKFARLCNFVLTVSLIIMPEKIICAIQAALFAIIHKQSIEPVLHALTIV